MALDLSEADGGLEGVTRPGELEPAVGTALAQWATDHDEEIKAARHTFDNR